MKNNFNTHTEENTEAYHTVNKDEH